MSMGDVADRGLVLLGCGKMGSAMLAGWLEAGLPSSSVWVIDPQPSDWLKSLEGLRLNEPLPRDLAVCIVAVKPQLMGDALGSIAELGGSGTLFVSIAAGTPIRQFEAAFGEDSAIIRAMPNTPAAIGKGISALIGNGATTESHMVLAEELLEAIGQTVRLETEAQIDAVTGLSGSGPAYVFHLIEAMTAAGVAQGLPDELSAKLALATVAGAGALAEASEDAPAQLRVNVTSPGGTTQAGLDVLMDAETGLCPLMERTVTAATKRGRALSE